MNKRDAQRAGAKFKKDHCLGDEWAVELQGRGGSQGGWEWKLFREYGHQAAIWISRHNEANVVVDFGYHHGRYHQGKGPDLATAFKHAKEGGVQALIEQAKLLAGMEL